MDCWPSLSGVKIFLTVLVVVALFYQPQAIHHPIRLLTYPWRLNDSNSDPSLPITSHLLTGHVPNISSSNSNSNAPLPPPQSNTSDSNSDDIHQMKRSLFQPCRILKRIPWASRASASKKLAYVVDQVVLHRDIPSWCRLLQFPKKCFWIPCRGGRCRNLATLVNKQINEESLYKLPNIQGVRNSSTSLWQSI